MKMSRAAVLTLWLLGVAAAICVVAGARYVTDLSAFLPARPTAAQRLLVDQLTSGPASRLILGSLQGGGGAIRSRIAAAMTLRLRGDRQFSYVDDGEPALAQRTQEFLFDQRYLLSDAVTAEHFSATGLQEAIQGTIDDLASSAGLMLKSLVVRDPTGELLHLLDALSSREGPRTEDGVWVSPDGTLTLLVVQTAAAGSDTDAQERALGALQAAFRAASADIGPAAATARLRLSGPGVFAVAARAKIKRAATRLSVLSSLLVIAVLLGVYRSVPALLLGLLPVATGALAGVAAVALGFGAVHGITLGFGITLIGESVDYSIYFFIQSQHLKDVAPSDTEGSAVTAWRRHLWPTIRLGMLASVCGFASLLPSGFPGLAQLGLYSISGLIAAACVTRFVLPELLPRRLAIRDVASVGVWLARKRDLVRRRATAAVAVAAWVLAAVAVGVVVHARSTLWNRDLSQLSPIDADDLRYDAALRADLGAANVLDLVVVRADTLEAALQGAERAAVPLRQLVDDGVIGQFDSPAQYLPSLAVQRRRQEALPDRATLQQNLRRASAHLALRDGGLEAFCDDVQTARTHPLLTAGDLAGTSLAAGFDALILHAQDHWSAMLPLHAADRAAAGTPTIDLSRVATALAAAGSADAQVLDLKSETDALYASYLHEAIGLSTYGLALIAVLLGLTLRSPMRVARVLAPLVLAVLLVAATLVQAGRQLSILHLVGMLLIVAVGSNYALFFDREATRPRDATFPLMLASLGLANLCTVIGFGLLSFSQVPVLEALGETVAPGAFLALVFASLLTAPASPGSGADA